MLIPLGHEQTRVRRLPWVSFGIMALCFLAFVAVLLSPSADPAAEQQAVRKAVEYFDRHPYLELDPRLREMFERQMGPENLDAMLEVARQTGPKPPADPAARRREQQELRRLVDAAFELRDRHPFFRWGLVPAHIRPVTVITHQFLHAGWLHLLGNLFIFYLCGPFVEDVWGRPLFAGFYLTGGAVAGLMFAARYPHLATPLVGASGAIAAVMGAFLVRYWRSKIRFFYWFGLVFRGTFVAPAWLVLGLWFLRELFAAQAMDLGRAQGGVAYWAHVWGFGFGVAVALVIRRLRIEERLVEPVIEQKLTVAANPVVDRAMEAWTRGEHEAALGLLETETSNQPGNVDLVLAFWNLACQGGCPERAAPRLMAAVRAELRSADPEIAADHWLELVRHLPAAAADPLVVAKVLETLGRANRVPEAREALDLVAPELPDRIPAGTLVRLERAAARLGGPGAVRVLEVAAASPEVPAEVRAETRQALGRLGGEQPPGTPAGASAGALPAPEPEPAGVRPAGESEQSPVRPVQVPRAIEVREAGLVELGEQELWLEVEGRGRVRLPYEKLQAVAVAGIRPPGGKGVLLLDLVLVPPWGDSPTVRTVRVTSRRFDPTRLVPQAESGLEAFRAVVGRILSASQATPLPSPAAVRGQPFAVFASVAAYEQEVLGIGVP